MRRQRMRSYLFLIWMLAWMAVIFLFSAQPGKESSATSNSVVDGLVALFGFWYDKLSAANQLCWYKRLTFLVRKAAHMSEYALLAFPTFLWLSAWKNWTRAKVFALSFFICAAYAALDELHQWFVPGRDARLLDVLIDVTGALIALVLLSFLMGKRKARDVDCAKSNQCEGKL